MLGRGKFVIQFILRKNERDILMKIGGFRVRAFSEQSFEGALVSRSSLGQPVLCGLLSSEQRFLGFEKLLRNPTSIEI